MLNLMVHAGGRVASRDEVSAVVTPPSTKTHFPIPHSSFIDLVEKTVENTGLRVTDEAFALSHKGNRLFGLLRVEGGGEERSDYTTVIGLRSAHDKSFPASTAVGNSVFVCDNLAFIGEQVIRRKHTKNIMNDLPGLLAGSFGRLGEMRVEQARRVDTYKEAELSDRQVNDLLISSMDAQVISSSMIRKVLREYREPRHREFREGGFTAWRMFNAYTEILKESNLFERPKRTQALYGLMDMTVGLN
jgi:hypothetical protein